VDTNSFDQLFLGRLRGDEPALADLTSGMSSVGIALWSGADSGYPGITPFEDAALTVVEANWPAYANFAGYRGPFSKLQLAALVAASATNDAGRKSLTDSYGNWFIAHGGVADVTGGASLPSLAHLTAWLSGWDNLNAAVAAPTGQYLYDTEEKIHLAIVATAMVGEWVALSALTDIITGFVTKNLVAAAVGASTAFRAWSAEEETFSTALRAGLNTFLEARHASNYDEVVNLVKDSIALNGKVNDILSLPGKIEQASKDVKGAAARAELQYYLRVLRNTFHGAVARLMQEHMIVTADLQPHWQDSVSAVNQVTTDPGAYLVVPPGSYGHAVPVPPQVVRGEPVYRGIPVTFVEAVVFSQFFRSLH
ncbi:MAG TPA: hypothetical protein VFN61_16225, partial [Acidimicrobiales bacterium]|nr:hypothetical protein [Acidimicrobiales bacterium]